MRKRAKVDTNHNELLAKCREVFGKDSVRSTAQLGDGFPDFVLGVRGFNFFFEVKRESGGKLTDDQVDFFGSWLGQVDVVRTLEDILAVVNRETA